MKKDIKLFQSKLKAKDEKLNSFKNNISDGQLNIERLNNELNILDKEHEKLRFEFTKLMSANKEEAKIINDIQGRNDILERTIKDRNEQLNQLKGDLKGKHEESNILKMRLGEGDRDKDRLNVSSICYLTYIIYIYRVIS